MEANMRLALLTLTLAVALVALAASAALAAAPEGPQQRPLFGPEVTDSCARGGFPTPKTFGFVVLNTPETTESTVIGRVVLTEATPNAKFAVDLVEGERPEKCQSLAVGKVATNGLGNAGLKFRHGRRAGTTIFWVSVHEESPRRKDVLASPAVALD
jgi:hypothetical protein